MTLTHERHAEDTQRIEELLDRLTGTVPLLERTIGGLRVAIADEADVLQAETVVINARGQWTRSYPREFRAVAVTNLGAHTLTVVGGPPDTGPPVAGTGVVLVPSHTARVARVRATSLTIYGTAGDTFDVTVLSRPAPPAWASGLTLP